MHEMALTQGIVDICEQNAGGHPITTVVVSIGALSGVVPEALEFCFEACSAGTLLEGARLRIELVPGRACCQECQSEQPMERLFDPCSQCGSFLMQIISGQDMRVREIEVED
ncbi:MAG: hydrogenase maturation nickel metallochaperone HypA [Trichlorobacter sp.]|jgi:hydrogenase nickel incorporation protein HypA/HybF